MTYDERHDALIAYLRVKVEEADWHGVSDAANDLRVMEAQRAPLADVAPQMPHGSPAFCPFAIKGRAGEPCPKCHDKGCVVVGPPHRPPCDVILKDGPDMFTCVGEKGHAGRHMGLSGMMW